jgi:hypothetical protein
MGQGRPGRQAGPRACLTTGWLTPAHADSTETVSRPFFSSAFDLGRTSELRPRTLDDDSPFPLRCVPKGTAGFLGRGDGAPLSRLFQVPIDGSPRVPGTGGPTSLSTLRRPAARAEAVLIGDIAADFTRAGGEGQVYGAGLSAKDGKATQAIPCIFHNRDRAFAQLGRHRGQDDIGDGYRGRCVL